MVYSLYVAMTFGLAISMKILICENKDTFETEMTSYEDTISSKMEECSSTLEQLDEDPFRNATVSSNNIKRDSKENLEFVSKCPSRPVHVNHTFTPRLGDKITMTIYAAGPACYIWRHNGRCLHSTCSVSNCSSYIVNIRKATDFGKYTVDMKQGITNSLSKFYVLARGPPAAVRLFKVTNITQSSASLSFLSGYDYNDKQTFVVRNFLNGKSADLKSIAGKKHDAGETPVIIHLNGLEPITSYNITVVAGNSRGYSEPADVFVYFKTPGEKPDSPNWCRIAEDSPKWCMIAIATGVGIAALVVVVVGIIIVVLKCKKRTSMTLPENNDMISDEGTDDDSLSCTDAGTQPTDGAVPGRVAE